MSLGSGRRRGDRRALPLRNGTRSRQLVLAAGAETTGLLVASDGLEHGLAHPGGARRQRRGAVPGRPDGRDPHSESGFGLRNARGAPKRCRVLGATNRLSTAPVRAEGDARRAQRPSSTAPPGDQPEFATPNWSRWRSGAGRSPSTRCRWSVGRGTPACWWRPPPTATGYCSPPGGPNSWRRSAQARCPVRRIPFPPGVSSRSRREASVVGLRRRSLVAQLTGPTAVWRFGRRRNSSGSSRWRSRPWLEGQLADDGSAAKLVRLSERAPPGRGGPWCSRRSPVTAAERPVTSGSDRPGPPSTRGHGPKHRGQPGRWQRPIWTCSTGPGVELGVDSLDLLSWPCAARTNSDAAFPTPSWSVARPRQVVAYSRSGAAVAVDVR